MIVQFFSMKLALFCLASLAKPIGDFFQFMLSMIYYPHIVVFSSQKSLCNSIPQFSEGEMKMQSECSFDSSKINAGVKR
jgi:hypothetical protein